MIRVLCATDGSEASLRAISTGLALLDLDRSRVVLVTAVPEPDPTLVTGAGFAGRVLTEEEYAEDVRASRVAGADLLQTAREQLGLPSVDTLVLTGPAGPALCDAARDSDAGLIVVGTRGRGGVARAVLGSVTDHVVRNAPCPVLTVGPDAEHDRIGPAVLCTDGSDLALHAGGVSIPLLTAVPVEIATVVAPLRLPVPYDGSGLEHVLTSSEEQRRMQAERDEGARAALDATAHALRPVVGGNLKTVALEGDPGPALCAHADDVSARVLVAGTRGRGSLRRALLGSVADHLVRNARCPVIVVGPGSRDHQD
ncbi:MAG: universal stress protein [Candidatus Nanopelagicales bacterium]